MLRFKCRNHSCIHFTHTLHIYSFYLIFYSLFRLYSPPPCHSNSSKRVNCVWFFVHVKIRYIDIPHVLRLFWLPNDRLLAEWYWRDAATRAAAVSASECCQCWRMNDVACEAEKGIVHSVCKLVRTAYISTASLLFSGAPDTGNEPAAFTREHLNAPFIQFNNVHSHKWMPKKAINFGSQPPQCAVFATQFRILKQICLDLNDLICNRE